MMNLLPNREALKPNERHASGGFAARCRYRDHYLTQ